MTPTREDYQAVRAQLATTTERFLAAVAVGDSPSAERESMLLFRLVAETAVATRSGRHIRPVFGPLDVGPGVRSWRAFLSQATPWERQAVVAALRPNVT